MYRKYPNLTLILATSPIVALALALWTLGLQCMRPWQHACYRAAGPQWAFL